MGGMMADFEGLRIAAWLPVDCEPVPPMTRVAIDRYNVTPIAMSRFGEKALRDAGYDPLYVPHGIETAVFQEHEDRDECKRSMGIDPDKFVVGMVAHNQGTTPPRKAFPQALQAFGVFRQSHPDAVLYLHTEAIGIYEGLNLVALAEVFGIPSDSIVIVPQLLYLSGEISKRRMAQVYSAMDVLLNPSMGEGFGIPIVEAQACGTPVVVSAWTSMPELCGAGWQVGGQPWYNPASGGMWLDPSTEEILKALELAYEARGNTELRQQAREFALQYDADRVMAEHWLPTLEALGKPREVPPLPTLNREQRRRLAKEKAAA
jgi:glycosyltransferase involved in cell wall biosynthesis